MVEIDGWAFNTWCSSADIREVHARGTKGD